LRKTLAKPITRNAGNATLTVNLIEVVGDFFYKDLSPTTMTLAANSEKSFWVLFKPTADGPKQGSLRVHSDAQDSPHSLELAGVGF